MTLAQVEPGAEFTQPGCGLRGVVVRHGEMGTVVRVGEPIRVEVAGKAWYRKPEATIWSAATEVEV